MHLTCGSHAGRCPRVPGKLCTVVPASGSPNSIQDHHRPASGKGSAAWRWWACSTSGSRRPHTTPPTQGESAGCGDAVSPTRPHQVINTNQSGRLIGDELDETETAQVSDAPARHRRDRHAEHRVIRVTADPGQRPDQHAERLRRQILHLAQDAIFQPRPPGHQAGPYARTASSSGIPPLTGPRAASSTSR